MAKVTFKVITPDKLDKQAYTLGQLLFVHDVDNKIGQIYLDYGGERVCYTTEPGMNYIGIADIDPSTITTSDGIIPINGNNIKPRLKDVVVFGKKEYMWRKDKDDDDKLKWMEIGDEESPDWLDSTGSEWNT